MLPASAEMSGYARPEELKYLESGSCGLVRYMATAADWKAGIGKVSCRHTAGVFHSEPFHSRGVPNGLVRQQQQPAINRLRSSHREAAAAIGPGGLVADHAGLEEVCPAHS